MDYDAETELEPGEFERMVGLTLFGLLMADVIAHPKAAAILSGGAAAAAVPGVPPA